MESPFCLALCLLTAAVSLLAFKQPSLLARLMFVPERILAHREWERLLSSALIHANAPHLIFNLLTLYMFGGVIENVRGGVILLGIYLAAVAGGSLLSLWLHRHQNYAALGASGGVCGVMFAAIFLQPGLEVGIFFIPLPMPGPVFALLYLAFTFYALHRGGGNIGHDAHFGGAVVGLALAALLAPENCLASPWMFGGSALLSLVALVVLARHPFAHSATRRPPHQPDERFRNYDDNLARRREEDEVNRILEKIAAHGIHSLTPPEREVLAKAAERHGR